MHVSKKEKCHNKLKVHESIMKDVNKITYLGDIMNSHGTIDDTITNRYSKALGIINQMSSLLSSISLGLFYFDTAFVLRESILLNSVLGSSESWSYINKKTHRNA